VPNLTDQGGFWVQWIGKDLNRHYVADFGCDHERLGPRNEDLVQILCSLPVQLPR
jgi:hypothetical protein